MRQIHKQTTHALQQSDEQVAIVVKMNANLCSHGAGAKEDAMHTGEHLLTTLPDATFVPSKSRVWLQMSEISGSILLLCPLSIISHSERITPAQIIGLLLPPDISLQVSLLSGQARVASEPLCCFKVQAVCIATFQGLLV